MAYKVHLPSQPTRVPWLYRPVRSFRRQPAPCQSSCPASMGIHGDNICPIPRTDEHSSVWFPATPSCLFSLSAVSYEPITQRKIPIFLALYRAEYGPMLIIALVTWSPAYHNLSENDQSRIQRSKQGLGKLDFRDRRRRVFCLLPCRLVLASRMFSVWLFSGFAIVLVCLALFFLSLFPGIWQRFLFVLDLGYFFASAVTRRPFVFFFRFSSTFLFFCFFFFCALFPFLVSGQLISVRVRRSQRRHGFY